MFTLALAQIRVEQGRMAENLKRAEVRIAEAAATGWASALRPSGSVIDATVSASSASTARSAA